MPPLPDDIWVKIPLDAQLAILGLVQDLEERIATLEVRVNQNASNSSGPPSTEQFHVKHEPPRPTSE